MSSQIQADVKATRTSVRMGSANYLLYAAMGLVLFAAFAVPFQETRSQVLTLLTTLAPTVYCLITYISRLESRITTLESQVDSHLTRDSIQD